MGTVCTGRRQHSLRSPNGWTSTGSLPEYISFELPVPMYLLLSVGSQYQGDENYLRCQNLRSMPQIAEVPQ
jgi:hypothetical protein